MRRSKAIITLALVLLLILTSVGAIAYMGRDAGPNVPVILSGGHDTDPKDGGRPVVLVAAALGVEPEVFREAFSGVTPAHDGKPSAEEARRNKEALMKILGPHGVTNERLDEVSDYYRYQPQRGGLWKVTAAKAHAVVEDGKVTQIVVTDAGSGYSTPPTATLTGMASTRLKVILQMSKDFKANGSVKSIEVVTPGSGS